MNTRHVYRPLGIALAAKKAAPEASLSMLVLAAQLLDVVWPIFILIGVERVTIAPGITRATPLDLSFIPILTAF